MSLSATITARRTSATLAASTRVLRGLLPATIAAQSAVAIAATFAAAIACTIAGVSVVTVSARFLSALTLAMPGVSTVSATLTARTSLAPATVAAVSTTTVRLQRDGYTRTTSASDVRVTSAGDTRIVVQIA